MEEKFEKEVVVIGAGGHATVVIDAINDEGKYCVSYLVDKSPSALSSIQNIPVIYDVSDFLLSQYLVAIGDNHIRKKCFVQFEQLGWRPLSIVHRTATVSTEAFIGSGVFVGPGAIINSGANIGNNVIINSGAIVEHECRIGDHSHIAPGAILGGAVKVGEGVLVGLGARILPQKVIGEWSILGSGSTLTKDVPELSIAMGSPARTGKVNHRPI